MKRTVSLLLCAALVLSLCACGGESTPATTESTVPPTTTEPAPSAADLYAQAVQKLAALENVSLEVTYIEEMALGADAFKTSSRRDVLLTGLGTDAFAARTEEEYYSGEARAYITETFLEGTVYSEINYDYYKSEMTAEDYLAAILPPVLLDESLYETVEQTSDTEFTFTGAEILESWCDTPYAILDTVTATATLGEDGLPQKYTYQASYTSGAADMIISVTVKVSPAAEDAVTAPEKADSYLTVSNIAAPYLLVTTVGYLDQAKHMTTASQDAVTCEAGAFTEISAVQMSVSEKNSSPICTLQAVYQLADLSTGTTEGYTLAESIVDGTLSSAVDGGEPEITEGITDTQVRSVVENELYYLYPATADINSLELTVIGDAALLEYTCTDEAGADFEDFLCEYFFGDPEILTNLATGSQIQENGGYIGIDLTTGLPLSLGQTFAMTHTVEGDDYLLSAAYSQSVQLGAKDAYEAVTGEAQPAEEPTEKPTPVFYHVTGSSGEEMWLLGTIHVGDERTSYLPQEIYDAFAASDALAVEFDSESYAASLMADEEAIQAYISALLYTDGTTLEDHLSAEALFEATEKIMKATGNYSDEATFLLTKPVFHYQTLSNFYMANGYRMSGDHGVDGKLETLAREQDKEILSVESGEFQMDLLGNLSDALQELMLKDTMEYGQFAYNYETEQLFEMWCRGDEAELIAYLAEEEDDSDLTEEEKALYEEYETALGGQRNVDMLAVAEEYLGSGKTVFYAVGLAHLLAEDGLVNTLRSAGYTVELVSYAG